MSGGLLRLTCAVYCLLLVVYSIYCPLARTEERGAQPMPAHKISVTFLRDRDHGGKSSQTDDIAQRLVEFVNGAKHSLHIAIYDCRLSPSLAGVVIPALKSAADRGVD